MLQAIREDDQLQIPSPGLNLATTLSQLMVHYENEESSYVRVCILSKIKQMIICQVHYKSDMPLVQRSQQSESAHSEGFYRIDKEIFYEDPKNTNTIFSAFFLKFLRRGSKNRSLPKGELQLIYHVVSLAIKYFYNEDHFKYLFNEITEQIENNKERVQPALDFFIEVVSTIEFNYEQSFYGQSENSGAKINHCKFERHFTTSHLNSMLAVANFFMKKAILKDNQTVEEGLYCENFKLRATEQHICSILELLHRVLCFDFIGEKFSENDENCLVTNIIIPTKNTKYTNLSEFQKWLKNSDWIRVYQFIYQQCQMVAIKLNIIQILGDMARIHMKYFKNKNCYKVHIQNLVYALADILEQSIANYSKEDLLKISIGFGRNLLKLTSPAIVPIFFEINTNIYGGLLESVKNFLVDHIISEDVFNVNIIYYFFKFIYNLHIRCKFQKSPGPFELIERVTRQICRNYENYLRVLLKKLFKCTTSQKTRESFHIRQDYLHLRQTFQSYNSEQIMIFLSPFKFMKPRYTSINSIQQLFVLVCAKITRSLYIFEVFPQNIRERQFALQMIQKSILQTIEWFTYTTYFKSIYKDSSQNQRRRPSEFSKKNVDNTFQLTMESINEEYEEQIQNQYQYCHILRAIAFFTIQTIDQIPERIYKYLNTNSEVFKLINFFLQVCFRADLQENQNRSRFNNTVKSKIEEQLQRCVKILQRLYLKQWQFQLFSINKEKNLSSLPYKYKSFENEYQFLDLGELKDQMVLINTIREINLPFTSQNESASQSLKQMQFLLAYSVARQEKSKIQKYSGIYTLEDCQCFLLLLCKNQALLHLLYASEPTLELHFQLLIKTIRQYQLKSNFISQINRYLEALTFLINIKYEQTSEEMTNRLFLFLYEVTCMLQEPEQRIKINEQFIECLRRMDEEHLRKKNQLEFQQLHFKIRSIIEHFYKAKQASN